MVEKRPNSNIILGEVQSVWRRNHEFKNKVGLTLTYYKKSMKKKKKKKKYKKHTKKTYQKKKKKKKKSIPVLYTKIEVN